MKAVRFISWGISICILVSAAALSVHSLWPSDCTSPLAPGADLRECDLRSRDFAGKELENLILAGADLRDVDFSRARLTNVRFENARLAGANFTAATLSGVHFTEAGLDGVNFTDSVLHDSSIILAVLTRANLKNTHLENSRIEHTDLSGASLHGTYIRQSSMVSSRFDKVIFDGVTLSAVSFRHADFNHTRIRRSEISDIQIYAVKFSDLEFSDSNLTGINRSQRSGLPITGTRLSLIRSCLSESYFDSARIAELVMESTRLHDINLDGAEIGMARLADFSLDQVSLGRNHQNVPFSLEELQSSDVRISRTSLDEARIQGDISAFVSVDHRLKSIAANCRPSS